MMNLSTDDRQKILEMADIHCYDIVAVVMDYSDSEDYFNCLDEKYDKRLIRSQLKKFRTRTMPELGAKRYNDLIRIKKRDETTELELAFEIDVNRTYLPNTKHDFIVSDIHECITTFKELLKKVGFNIEVINEIEKITGRDDTRIIVAGDYLDKGYQTKKTVEFLYNNINRICFVDANHENFVERWLSPQINNSPNAIENVSRYSSISGLEENEELKNRFIAIRKLTVPFYVNKHFIVTHAGCENKYLGKTQKFALREQRYYHVDRFENDKDEEWLESRRRKLNYLKEQAEACHPLHIFGHEAFSNNLIYKNKIHIDTGCCHEARLTGVEVDKNTGLYRIWSVPCSEMSINKLTAQEKLREFKFEEPKIELNDRDILRLRWSAKNKINFVSGTMCPADKRENELEDINEAFDYFKSKHIEKVMLQIKYMGSRCNVYLFNEIEKSYAVTRNGFVIKQLDLTDIYKKLMDRPSIKNYFKENDLELMILDGELMPWSALGEGLIESVFQTIDKGVSSELNLLEDNGFEEQLSRIQKEYKESQFDNDKHTMKKEELYSKYGAQKYEAYKLLSGFYMPEINELKDLHQTYSKQLDVYARPFNKESDKAEYQPFSILKSVKKNGDEILYFDSDNETLFKMVSDVRYLVCDLSNSTSMEESRWFFDYVIKVLKLEGIVIKPLKVDNKYCAPYIKVRSPSYLTIIYGYDYLNKVKYNQMLEQKRIIMKLQTSIDEWQIGKKLLQIPYKDISENNKKYNDLMTKIIVEINKEEDLDPRL